MKIKVRLSRENVRITPIAPFRDGGFRPRGLNRFGAYAVPLPWPGAPVPPCPRAPVPAAHGS